MYRQKDDMFNSKFPAVAICSLGLVLLSPSPGAVAAEDYSSIPQAIERSYEGSRFDTVNVRLENCIIEVELIDSSACDGSTKIKSIKKRFDFFKNQTDPRIRTAKDYGAEKRFNVRFIPTGDWARQVTILEEEANQLVSEARSEIGWGQQAATLAYQRFFARHREASLGAYTISGFCPTGNSINFGKNWLSVQTQYPNKLAQSFEALAGRCR